MSKSSSSRAFRNHGRLKAEVRGGRKMSEIDRKTTPEKHNALLNGYEKTMKVLARGCGVT